MSMLDDIIATERELKITLGGIEASIQQVKATAAEMGIDASLLRTTDGRWAINELLVAKANTLNGLVILMRMKELYAPR